MKTFEITKEQILLLAEQHGCSESKLKQWFPEAFQSELEVGKWYKRKAELLVWNDGKETYGFNSSGMYKDYMLCSCISNPILPTDKEVETALIAEAKRRGFKEGVRYNFKNSKNIEAKGRLLFNFTGKSNDLFFEKSERFIFRDGVWAEIISEPIELTLEQRIERIEEQLKIKK